MQLIIVLFSMAVLVYLSTRFPEPKTDHIGKITLADMCDSEVLIMEKTVVIRGKETNYVLERA